MSLASQVVARLKSQLPARLDSSQAFVYDGKVDVRSVPADGNLGWYTIVYCGAGLRTVGGVVGQSKDGSWRFQVTSVCWLPGNDASPATACRVLQGNVITALTDWKPAAETGIVSYGPVQHDVSRDPVADEAIEDRTVIFAVDQFTVQADRS